MTLELLLPYILSAVGGFALRHFNVLGKLGSLIAGPAAPLAPAIPAATTAHPVLDTIKADVSAMASKLMGTHPVLSDAVTAAIKQAVADETSGQVASAKGELLLVIQAAVKAAMADMTATKTS